MKVVYIEWFDPTSIDEWTELEKLSLEMPHTITSIGQVVKENKDAIMLALNYDPKGGVASCSILIPKACISFIRELRVSRNVRRTKKETKKAKTPKTRKRRPR